MLWHGYFTISRGNIGAGNWADLIALVNEIQTNGQRSEYQLTDRINIVGDAINYEARYNDGAVSFDKFAEKLATSFEIDVNDIIINTEQITYDQYPTVKAAYEYLGSARFYIELMGCPNDVDLCSWEQSNAETIAMLFTMAEFWDSGP